MSSTLLGIAGHLFEEADKDPSHRISCQLLRLETIIEYMANPIVLARLSSLDLLLYDSWSFIEFLEAWKKLPPANKSRAAAEGHARVTSIVRRPSLSDLPYVIPSVRIVLFLNISDTWSEF